MREALPPKGVGGMASAYTIPAVRARNRGSLESAVFGEPFSPAAAAHFPRAFRDRNLSRSTESGRGACAYKPYIHHTAKETHDRFSSERRRRPGADGHRHLARKQSRGGP